MFGLFNFVLKLKAMTLSEYEHLEQDFISSTDIGTYLKAKGVSPYKYYYWKRKSREIKESLSITDGQFLPIDLHSEGFIKQPKRGKNSKPEVIGKGEIEIELRTANGAEYRIRGIIDSLMVSSIIASSGGRRNV